MNLIIRFSLFQVCSATLTFYMWPLFEGRASFTLMSNISDDDMKVFKLHKYFFKQQLFWTVPVYLLRLLMQTVPSVAHSHSLIHSFIHSYFSSESFGNIWWFCPDFCEIMKTRASCVDLLTTFIHSCRQNAHVIIWILFLTALSLVYWSRDSTN